MAHDEWIERLYALHDGELTGAAREEAERHLEACAECRQQFQAWEQVAGTLFRIPEPRPSEAFVGRIMERLEIVPEVARVRARQALPARWWIPAMGMALAAAWLIMVVPSQSHAVTTDALLLAADEAQPDDVLGFVMEGSS